MHYRILDSQGAVRLVRGTLLDPAELLAKAGRAIPTDFDRVTHRYARRETHRPSDYVGPDYLAGTQLYADEAALIASHLRELDGRIQKLNAERRSLIDRFRHLRTDPLPLVAGVCRVCGCTDDKACPTGCAWADTTRTICTRCVGNGAAAPDAASRDIQTVFLFPNGMVAVTDLRGEQIGELQGPKDRVPWKELARRLSDASELKGITRAEIERRAAEGGAA